MPTPAQTVCEACLTPVAWEDLEPAGFGVAGPCPACGERIVRPRRRPVPPQDDVADQARAS